MVKRVLDLPTNDSKIYKQILAFLNFGLNASYQEREVLAEIMRMNNEWDILPDEKRGKYILSTDIRKDMCTALDMKDTQFNVILSRVRTKTIFGEPVLDENNILSKHLLFKPDKEGIQIEINLVNTPEIVKEEIEVTVVKPTEPEQVIEDKPTQGIQKTEDPMVNLKKLAAPSNGLDNIIEDTSSTGLMILPPTNG